MQNQLVEVPPERQPLERPSGAADRLPHGVSRGPSKAGTSAPRPRPREAPPLHRCPRVSGSLASSSSSLQRGPGTPRPCPRLGLALLEPAVPSSGEMTGPRPGGAPVPPRPGLPNTSVGRGSGWSTPGGSKVWGPQRPGWGAGGAGEDADRDMRGRDPRPQSPLAPRTESISGTVGGEGRESGPGQASGLTWLAAPPSQVTPPLHSWQAPCRLAPTLPDPAPTCSRTPEGSPGGCRPLPLTTAFSTSLPARLQNGQKATTDFSYKPTHMHTHTHPAQTHTYTHTPCTHTHTHTHTHRTVSQQQFTAP